MDGEVSSWVPVTSGVPQGSVIGPILFLVYINDLPAKLQSKVRLFADDTIVYMVAVTNETDAAILQKDLKLLEEWENRSQMSFHLDKCNVLRVTRCGNPLTHDYILQNQIGKRMQLNILVSLYTINCPGTSIILPEVFSDETYKFTRNTSRLMHTRLLFDHKLSMRLLYGILSPKRTKIKLRWYREELPALLATTTDAKQVSLTCLMSLAGAVSSREEQTKD